MVGLSGEKSKQDYTTKLSHFIGTLKSTLSPRFLWELHEEQEHK